MEYPAASMPNNAEPILVVRDKLSNEARLTRIAHFVSCLGFEVSIEGLQSSSLKDARDNMTVLSSIKSPDDILVREHVDELAQTPMDNIIPGAYVKAFHYIINGGWNMKRQGPLFTYQHPGYTRNPKWEQHHEPIPMRGVQIVKREDVGLPQYKSKILTDKNAVILARYGAITGTVMSAFETLIDGTFEGRKPSMQTSQALTHLVITLNEQIRPNTPDRTKE